MSYVTKRYTVGFVVENPLSWDSLTFDDLTTPMDVDSSDGPKAAADAYLRQFPATEWYGLLAALDRKGHRVFIYAVEAAPRLQPYSPAGSAVAV